MENWPTEETRLRNRLARGAFVLAHADEKMVEVRQSSFETDDTHPSDPGRRRKAERFNGRIAAKRVTRDPNTTARCEIFQPRRDGVHDIGVGRRRGELE